MGVSCSRKYICCGGVAVSNFTDDKVFAYFYNYDLLDRSDWHSQSNMEYLYENMDIMHLQGDEWLAIPESDEYIFNFNGYSGSFFLNHKGEWVVKCNEMIKIKVDETITENFQLPEEKRFGEIQTHYIKRIIYGFTFDYIFYF